MDKTNFQSLKNHFLIAMPHLQEEDGFHHSVTYLCEHNEQGAMGLVINRQSGIDLAEVFDQLKIEAKSDNSSTQPILVGGPVHPERGFILHTREDNKKWESSLPVTDHISLTTSLDILTSIANNEGPENCLLALGYAGWSAGQLEQEMQNNVWLTVPADSQVIFNTPCEQRLDAAAALLGIRLEQMAPGSGHA